MIGGRVPLKIRVEPGEILGAAIYNMKTLNNLILLINFPESQAKAYNGKTLSNRGNGIMIKNLNETTLIVEFSENQ